MYQPYSAPVCEPDAFFDDGCKTSSYRNMVSFQGGWAKTIKDLQQADALKAFLPQRYGEYIGNLW